MKQKIAEYLLEIEAVFLQPNNPFTLSSGLRSPIYCDNRLIASYPEIRKVVAKGLAGIIEENFPEVEVIAGTATAGIPHAAWVSDVLNLPMCYVRSKAKEHGKGKLVEGKVPVNQKVVVVEDLISTGGSAITTVNALREEGCEVLGIVSIFSYNLEVSKEKLANTGVPFVSLSDYPSLIEVALKKNVIKDTDVENLESWRKDPASWGN